MFRKTFILFIGLVLGCLLLYCIMEKEEKDLSSSWGDGRHSIPVMNNQKEESAIFITSQWCDRHTKDRKEKGCLANGIIHPVALSETCPITLKELKDFHERLSRISQDDEDRDEQIKSAMALLQDISNRDLAALLSHLASDGDPVDRMKALDIIGHCWKNLSATEEDMTCVDETTSDIMDMENEDVVLVEMPDHEASIETDDRQVEDILGDILMGCLSDDDSQIRHQAIEVLGMLPDDVSDAISTQVLSGDFSDVKKSFLEQHAGSDNFSDISLFFHALDDQDDEIIDYARKNINTVLDMDFTSAAEAFEWWEQQNQR